jgi:hypothetical protein
MYDTDHKIPYLYIRNSAPQDWGEQRPLRDDPLGQAAYTAAALRGLAEAVATLQANEAKPTAAAKRS